MKILFSVLLGGGCGVVWALLEIGIFFRGLKSAEQKAAAMAAAGGEEAKIAAAKKQNNYVMKYFLCKYGLDIALLVLIFLARGALPYRWEYILLSAGIVLALVTQLVFVRFVPRRQQP